MNSVEKQFSGRVSRRRQGALVVVSLTAFACGSSLRGTSEPALQTATASVPAGASKYNEECASCHGKRGEGMGQVPAIMGGGSLGKFATAEDLFKYVKTAMPLPQSRVGSLSDEQYWSVVSFMLACRKTKLPEGGLTAENAASVAISH